MKKITAFWNQPCPSYRNFQIAFAALTLNFFIPALSYVFSPEIIGQQFIQVNQILGGASYSFPEEASLLWRYLGSANVMALAVMCFLLQLNLRKFFPVLIPLGFLKGYTATLFLAGYLRHRHYPALLAVALLDYATTGVLVFFANRAHRAIQQIPKNRLVPRLQLENHNDLPA